MIVRDLMRTDLKTVSTKATIAEAIAALVDAHVSALPVVDSFGRAVGVISARDILEAERAHRPFDETLVLEVMQAWPATVTPDAAVRTAAEQMLRLGTHRLFVEDRGALVGVFSLTDVARALALAAA